MTGDRPPRWIDYVPLAELTPAAENPKGHDLPTLRASIERFGLVEVAAVEDGRTGRVISGHGRLEDLAAAEAAGLEPPEGVTIADDGRWRVPASEEAYRSFVELLIPSPAEHGEQISKRVADNIADARRSLRSVYDASPTCDAHRGSALGLVDAAFEYLDHLRGFRNRDSYLGRCLLKPEPLKAKAVQIAREVCTA